MQENHTTSNKTTWPLCCRISCRNSRTRRHLKCKQNKFDSKAGTTARAIALAVVPALLSNLFYYCLFCPTSWVILKQLDPSPSRATGLIVNCAPINVKPAGGEAGHRAGF